MVHVVLKLDGTNHPLRTSADSVCDGTPVSNTEAHFQQAQEMFVNDGVARHGNQLKQRPDPTVDAERAWATSWLLKWLPLAAFKAREWWMRRPCMRCVAWSPANSASVVVGSGAMSQTMVLMWISLMSPRVRPLEHFSTSLAPGAVSGQSGSDYDEFVGASSYPS